MKTGRLWLLAALCLLLVLAAGTAFADGPTDPGLGRMRQFMKQEHEGIRRLKEREEAGGDGILRYDSSYGEVSAITRKGTLKPLQKQTFSVTLTGSYRPEQVEFTWTITDLRYDYNYLYYPNYPENGTLYGKTSISYKFYSAGTYRVSVWVMNGQEVIGFATLEFEIPDDGVHDTLEERITNIVNNNKGSTKWETAIKLYDWLTHHAYYDSTLEHHGSDILFSGYGVCDSYSMAYMLLCREAGITCERPMSDSHAWNSLKFGNVWCQADPTWDDPGSWAPGQGSVVGGNEGHQLLFVNSDIMQSLSAHTTIAGYDCHASDCTSLDLNYYIYKNRWKNLGNPYADWDYDQGSWQFKSYVDMIGASFDAGSIHWETEKWEWVYYKNGNSYESVGGSGNAYKILSWALSNNASISLKDGGKVRVEAKRVSPGSDDEKVSVDLKGWDLQETGTLKIPAKTTTIEADAFVKTGATTVKLNKCKYIRDRAFKNSAVRTVYVPLTVQQIAANAFDGCGRIIFITKNEKAITYAAAHNIIVLPP